MALIERFIVRLLVLTLLWGVAGGSPRGGLPGVTTNAGLSASFSDKIFHGFTNNGETPMYDVIVHWDGAVGHFMLHNLTDADITFDFNLDLQHIEAAAALPRRVVVGPHQTREAVTVRRMTSEGWSYRYTISCTFGRPDARPDNYVYRLPYADGTSYRVVQGYGGSFSHHDPDSWYSLDFDMPEGTPVLAVRDGTVVVVVNNYTDGGATEEYRNKANYVLVRQPDGTYAEYDHLEKDSMGVHPGQAVHAGQPLARSGATGYASGPHLHLCVFTGRDGLDRLTFPTRFQVSSSSSPVTLADGGLYTAVRK